MNWSDPIFVAGVAILLCAARAFPDLMRGMMDGVEEFARLLGYNIDEPGLRNESRVINLCFALLLISVLLLPFLSR